MAASLDDILTTQKNGVQAINELARALSDFKTLYESFVGTQTTNTLVSETGALIKVGSGRVVNFAVSGTPTGVGYLYDASSVAEAIGNTPTDIICEIPATNGIYPANLFFHDGLILVCGAGMQVNVTYS